MTAKEHAKLWRGQQRVEEVNLKKAARRRDIEAGEFHNRMAQFCEDIAERYQEQAAKEGRG